MSDTIKPESELAKNTCLAKQYYKEKNYKNAFESSQKADQDDPIIQFNLGIMYYDQGDTVKAFEWFHKVAEQGDAFAQGNLGNMYLKGEGVAQDDAQAFEWYHKAAEQGVAQAQLDLGAMYSEGQGVAQDYIKAVEWFQKAAEQGEVNAQCNLAMMYLNGEGVAQNEVQAFEWYHKAAEQGDAQSQTKLGVMYAYGKGVAQDEVQAFKWHHKAAKQGYAFAQLILGGMYEYGKGVAQDDAQAFEWYQKAAKQDLAQAQLILGGMYEYGKGVTQNDAQAFEWYHKAAEQGEVNAQANLEKMSAYGQGVAQNDACAKVAKHGDASAILAKNTRLAKQYYKEKNYGNAFEYSQKADQIDPEIQFNFAIMYSKAQDAVNAFEWCLKAAEQGHADAQANLEKMSARGQGVVAQNPAYERQENNDDLSEEGDSSLIQLSKTSFGAKIVEIIFCMLSSIFVFGGSFYCYLYAIDGVPSKSPMIYQGYSSLEKVLMDLTVLSLMWIPGFVILYVLFRNNGHKPQRRTFSSYIFYVCCYWIAFVILGMFCNLMSSFR